MRYFASKNENYNPSDHHYIIIGGGPVGCYLAYKLLTNANSRVVMFENKKFERSQVIRIPYAVANDLPIDIKNKMWCNKETYSRIFDPALSTDKNFWPKPDYSFWPWISIGTFQKAFIHFLKTNAIFKDRFFFIPGEGDFTNNNWLKSIQNVYPNIDAAILGSTRVIFCTCGIYAKSLRQELDLLRGKMPQIKGHGIYLIYQNKTTENYIRNAKPMSYAELAENGISYAVANNSNYDVQLYTYPEGNLTAIFDEIPEEFIQRASYNQNLGALDMLGTGLSNDAKKWFERYKHEIVTTCAKFEIPLPIDLKRIKIFYAQRTEYYWEDVATQISWQGNSKPLFFLGDSAGSTDYKLGLSVGRGLLSAQTLSELLTKYTNDFSKIISDFKIYWNDIIKNEFNKSSQLTAEPKILYNYLIKGRDVIFPENSHIHFTGNEQYETYLDKYQQISSDFYRTHEANVILLINTAALKSNIKYLIKYSKKVANSKIVAVVKSNGYGLGAKLVTDIAIRAGIDFIATAKLEEAIKLRNSSIAKDNRVRIMVFDTPLPHDITTYVMNRIEPILPSDQNGNSIELLENSLVNKPFLLSSPLKVHIMVDTGMRRDGGIISSVPESVLKTVKRLQCLEKNRVEFAGLATHLACHRCTDYQGEEVIDYRILQLQRLQNVFTYLLANKIHVPLLHIGGGLGLLAEQWPMQFEALIKKSGTELYTRIGHGLYGMELEKDLNMASSQLYPVAELNLQVRNIFFVDGNEPVSYGGLWRTPKEGAWIATLSGGWADGIPYTTQTLGKSESGMVVSIHHELYPVIGKINMNAMMVNLGSKTKIKAGDRAVIFGWKSDEPQLNNLAEISGHISASIIANIPAHVPRILVSEEINKIPLSI
ncbi:alanine racemase [Gammaproteobacteria bacterium SCGC AG-212-F23]|nr:alanine racemase [Gammaproteobacteria bacterium SCGC AG-212-F23]